MQGGGGSKIREKIVLLTPMKKALLDGEPKPTAKNDLGAILINTLSQFLIDFSWWEWESLMHVFRYTVSMLLGVQSGNIDRIYTHHLNAHRKVCKSCLINLQHFFLSSSHSSSSSSSRDYNYKLMNRFVFSTSSAEFVIYL